MRSRVILGASALASVAAFTACGSSSAVVVDSTPTVTYVAQLSGANEKPNANASTASGTATYTLKGNSLSYVVTVSGLTTPSTQSHLHVGSAAASGPVVVGYVTGSVQSGNVTAGTIDLSATIANGTSSITGDSLKILLNNGNAYTNVHTSTYPGGEIRGQIVKQ